MQIQPYLFFDGRCEEAIDFYKKAVGAEVGMLMRFKEAPEKGMCAPGNENKVMHAALKIGDTTVMASDGHSSGHPEFKGISLSISTKTDGEAVKIFNALGEGGKVQQPLVKTFFSSSFGMVADKFGVGWMVVVEK